jgi:hypothetical protein
MSDEATYFIPSEAEVDADEEISSPGLDEVELQALLQEMAEEARDWREEFFDPFVEEATKLFKGDLPTAPDAERSGATSFDVRDAIRSIMPSLMRVFFGPERVVEFLARGREDQALARQQTDVVDLVVREDNKGFLIFYTWFKDALRNRLGFAKWWWEDIHEEQHEPFEGVTLAEIGYITNLLEQEVGVDEVEIEESAPYIRSDDGEEVYDIMARYRSNDGRVRFDSVPPEEMIWSPEARAIDGAMLLGHVRDVPADMLRAMDDLDQDIVEASAGDAQEGRLRSEPDNVRRFADEGTAPVSGEETRDESTELTQYAELYARIDVNGDGIGELRLFKCVGADWEIANGDGMGELTDEVPFTVLCPEPEPHAIMGLSITDIVQDIQKVKSYVLRASLDSLAHAIDPVTEVVASEVNMRDVMSKALSRVVRVKRPQMMREVPHRWVGGDGLEMMSYLDSMKEDRTGRGKAAAGLDPSVLQSSTKAAVMATVSGSQQQLELIARIFAETGVSELYKGILRLLVKHQDQTRRRIVRLRGDFVPMDPSKWDATMDVRVNVALGSGLIEDKLATLNDIFEKQMALLQMGAPIISWRGIRTTMAKMVELGGWPSADEFYEPFGEQQQQEWDQQQAQSEGQQDPQQMLVQIEGQRVQLEAQEAQAKMALDERKMTLEDDRERDKTARQFAIESAKLRAQTAGTDADRRLSAAVEQDRMAQDADLKREEAERAAQERAQNVSQPDTSGAQ